MSGMQCPGVFGGNISFYSKLTITGRMLASANTKYRLDVGPPSTTLV